jgi:hypothetical protein
MSMQHCNTSIHHEHATLQHKHSPRACNTATQAFTTSMQHCNTSIHHRHAARSLSATAAPALTHRVGLASGPEGIDDDTETADGDDGRGAEGWRMSEWASELFLASRLT